MSDPSLSIPSGEDRQTPDQPDQLVPAGVSPTPLTGRDLQVGLQRAVLLSFGLFLAYQLAGPLTTLLLLFLLVFILAAVLNPVVVWLQRRGVPRTASAVGLAVLLVGAVGLLGWLLLPALLDELGSLIQNLPRKQERLSAYYQSFAARYPALAGQVPAPEQLVANLGPHLTRILGQVGRYTMNLAVGFFSLLLMLVLVVFTLAQPAPLVTGLLGAVPQSLEGRVETALRRILAQLKSWAAGSVLLGLIVGVMTGIGLWSISRLTGNPFPYILLFSVLAGIGELIPNIGPILSAVPPVLVALAIDPILGLWVALLFLLIQQLENNLIVPLVMGKSLDLHPVSLIFTVLVMGVLFGLLGAILAVPVAAIIKVSWEEFHLIPQGKNLAALQETANAIVGQSATMSPGRETPGESSLSDGEGATEAGEQVRPRKSRPVS